MLGHILRKVSASSHLDTKAKIKIAARILLAPTAAKTLEQTLERIGLSSLSARHPRIFEKVSRPYLANGLDRSRKLELVCRHYTLLAQHFGVPAVDTIYTQGLRLLESVLTPYDASIRLHYDGAMEKEGELMISLDLAGRRAYSLALVLGQDEMFIGSLQGSKTAYEEIRRFTKASHGVRPHNFLVFLARVLAEQLKCRSLHAINNASHVYQARSRTQERIQFDYDTFWTETGGTPDDRCFFRLPLIQPRKELAEIAANKRAQYRRRYEFLDECQAAFAMALRAPGQMTTDAKK